MHIPSYKKISVITAILIAVLLSNSAQAAVKNAAGSPCKKAGVTQVISGKNYICSYASKKLVWKIKPALKGQTWEQIAAEKLAGEIKAAEELRAKTASEAKAAAELKAREEEARLAAELKAKEEAAAKFEAERPKIPGLTIGTLLWGDDFKGSKNSSINNQNWSARNCHRTPEAMGGGACFDAEAIYYAPSAVKLDGSQDGAAVISTTRITSGLPSAAGKCLTERCAFVSGRFDTHGKVSFQYGFIEARIKMPVGSGNHPAFWMLGDNINQVGWPTSGEMDITEIRGNEPTIDTSATHYTTTYAPNTCCWNHQYKVASLPVGVDLSLDFHTYALAWLPNSISYYVDGRLISTTTLQTLGGYWSFNEKFFIILNNAVNSTFSGSWENLQSSTMTIDWVRSYQLNGQGQVYTK